MRGPSRDPSGSDADEDIVPVDGVIEVDHAWDVQRHTLPLERVVARRRLQPDDAEDRHDRGNLAKRRIQDDHHLQGAPAETVVTEIDALCWDEPAPVEVETDQLRGCPGPGNEDVARGVDMGEVGSQTRSSDAP